MITTKQLIAKYGNPFENADAFIKQWMILWDIPDDINKSIPALPNKMYVNKEFAPMLEKVFRELIARKLDDEIKTFDGCFNIRTMRGSKNYSRHSWGIAIDLNAFENPYKKVPKGELIEYRKKYIKWSPYFLDTFRELGFECGADWQTVVDGMHFEPKVIPS